MSERIREHHVIAIADIKLAASYFIALPEGGTIKKITACIGLTIIVDADFSAEIGGVAVTGSAFTITASGSQPGDIDEVEPTAANVVPRDGSLEIINDGAATTGGSVCITIEVERNVA